jgi:hypothetical protein
MWSETMPLAVSLFTNDFSWIMARALIPGNLPRIMRSAILGTDGHLEIPTDGHSAGIAKSTQT